MYDIDNEKFTSTPSELDVTTLPSWAQDKLSRSAIDFTLNP